MGVGGHLGAPITCDVDRGAPRLLPGRAERWGVWGPSRGPHHLRRWSRRATALAGARRARGGLGAISGPPSPATLIEARHGFCRGAPSDGGFGGHLGAPIKMDDFEAWFDKGVTD